MCYCIWRIITSISTCFGHHYAHLQENKDRVLLHMAYYYNFYLNMFRASLCPSSGEQRPCVTAYSVLLSTSISTCFGHHYAHLQEKKDRVLLHMAYYYQLLSQHVSGIIMPIFRRSKTWCYCIRCTAGCEHCSHPTTQRPTTATNHIQQNQSSTPYAVTHGL